MSRRAERLIGLFLLAVLLVGPIALALAARPAMLFGAPLLYVYFFAAWAGIIVLLALIVRGADGSAAE
jgi:hypothetical protein